MIVVAAAAVVVIIMVVLVVPWVWSNTDCCCGAGRGGRAGKGSNAACHYAGEMSSCENKMNCL